MRTQTTNLFLVEDLEDVGRTGELAENRVNDELTEQLVKGHEDIFYGYEFAIQGGGEKLPDEVLRYYFDLFSDPDVLRGSFGLCRAWDATLAERAAQEPAARDARPGDRGSGELGPRGREHDEARRGRRAVRIIPGSGHWVAEEEPEKLLAALAPFLAPYQTAAR